ncbi:glycosyltransferase [Pedobacter panaciterrae]
MGGVEKTLLNCLPYLGKNGDSLIICCFQTHGELEKRFLENGVEIVSIKKTGSILLDCIQLLKVIKKYKIDIVHSRFSYTSGGFVLAAFFMNRSSIVSIHSSKPVGFGKYKNIFPIGFLLKQQLKLHKLIVLGLADRIVGHSRANLNVNFKNWDNNKKFKVIHNGVDFIELSGGAIDSSILNDFIKNSRFNILHIGSMRSPKNHMFLLDCFKLLEPKK